MNHSLPQTLEMPCTRRRAGVLLPIFSLPSGRLGAEAVDFLEHMAVAGLSVWQVLPLGPTLSDGSPYQCSSSFALNPAFLDEAGLLADPAFEAGSSLADRRCGVGANEALLEEFARFSAQAEWLAGYSEFVVLKQQQGQAAWWQWPVAWRDRHPQAMQDWKTRHQAELFAVAFEQFLLDRQWRALMAEAHARGILLYGDLPIFVAGDSADVWLHRAEFQLTAEGLPVAVAGVPPDYFSATGQRWGNPLFDWSAMARNEFAWWRARMRRHRELFDWVRIDHFRGLAAYWSIPAECATAIEGAWVPAPGAALLAALQRDAGGCLPVIAEDLGVITDDVIALRDAFNLPGMRILQFAFDSDEKNPYLPQNHTQDSVVYTGTHDNNTTLGWWQGLDATQQQRVRAALNDDEAMPWALIDAALNSVAGLAIIPLADFLALDERGRINTPGTTVGNWHWRFDAASLTKDLLRHIAERVAASGRKITTDRA
ncbi:4-alpha-glucanotransferase [Halothiobacillus sp. DCM-1]|uniref:4-alpha-glucanotransferase n=1 Tax=Halothiobacillus sp. DCM-1 TaxID=3112558 RepID=UPI00324BDE56